MLSNMVTSRRMKLGHLFPRLINPSRLVCHGLPSCQHEHGAHRLHALRARIGPTTTTVARFALITRPATATGQERKKETSKIKPPQKNLEFWITCDPSSGSEFFVIFPPIPDVSVCAVALIHLHFGHVPPSRPNWPPHILLVSRNTDRAAHILLCRLGSIV